MEPATKTVTEAATVRLPLESIALSTASNRQIRPLKSEGVRRLVEESDPTTWDAILVRAWPESDPYPTGEEGRQWQVIAGYHRTTAARQLGLATIKAQIVADVPDDTAFLLLALTSNLRHGEQMTREEKVVALKRLQASGMSYGDIEKATGIKRGTVQNWLSGRDTNAGRLKRDATGDRQDADGLADVPSWGGDVVVKLSDQRRAQVEQAIDRALTAADGVTRAVTPAEAHAWWLSILPSARQGEARRIHALIAYFTGLASLADVPDGTRER